MILTCDQCQARYTVDDNRLGTAPRTVRCSSCGHTWRFAPAETAASDAADDAADRAAFESMRSEEQAVDAEAPVLRSFRPPSRVVAKPAKGPSRAVPIAMMVAPTVLVLVVLLGARDMLTAMWPPATRLYGTLGMSTPLTAPGLSIVAVRTTTRINGDHRTLLIEGELSNSGTAPHPIPALHATLSQADEVKARWTFAADASEVPPGQTVQFHTKLDDAPNGAGSVSIGVWR